LLLSAEVLSILTPIVSIVLLPLLLISREIIGVIPTVTAIINPVVYGGTSMPESRPIKASTIIVVVVVVICHRIS
jgi:hypothetical protein